MSITGNRAGHPLDRVVWHALTTSQSDLALGSLTARAYKPSFSPFAAFESGSLESLWELAGLVEIDAELAFVTQAPLPTQPWFDVLRTGSIDQMLGPARPIDVPDALPIVALDDYVEQIRALVEIAKPGPFRQDTHRLGRFVGIFDDDGKELLAMSGERMRLTGFTEVSAVCAHPTARGRGLAAATVVAITNGILSRGDEPFLHVFSDNQSAIALYRKLGFTLRAQLLLTALRRNDTPL